MADSRPEHSTNWLARREGWRPQADDTRDPGDTDYARVIHSASFRRLQGKTQILTLGDSDFYRTRLTHSLEVAQIAGGIVSRLAAIGQGQAWAPHLPGRAMIQTIGCTHDLGHPPFGHGGEVALNYCMRDHGGFEGNGQTLRILSRLEMFSDHAGSNLTRRTLLGILKYPASYSMVANPDCVARLAEQPQSIRIIDAEASKPPKCHLDGEEDVVQWVLEPLSEDDRRQFRAVAPRPGKHGKPLHKSFDCSVMDIADDIAYGVHDLEDAIALGLVSEAAFREAVADSEASCFLDSLRARYPGEGRNDLYDHMIRGLFGDGHARKRFIGRLVYHFIAAVEVVDEPAFTEPLVRFRARLGGPQRKFLDALQALVVDEVIQSPAVQHLEFKGQAMVVAVFEAIASDPRRLLPRLEFQKFDQDGVRVICDYVAAMTDTTLLKTYERLFSPRMGSVFDRL